MKLLRRRAIAGTHPEVRKERRLLVQGTRVAATDTKSSWEAGQGKMAGVGKSGWRRG